MLVFYGGTLYITIEALNHEEYKVPTKIEPVIKDTYWMSCVVNRHRVNSGIRYVEAPGRIVNKEVQPSIVPGYRVIDVYIR